MGEVACAGDGCCEAGAEGCKTLTFGQKAVGVNFNPSGQSDVDQVKQMYADIIDLMKTIQGEERSEKAALLTIAYRDAQKACMQAVKGLTWKDRL